MKRAFVRLLIVVLSVGWIVPLTLSFWAVYGFVQDVIWPFVNQGQVAALSWHPFDWADDYFYVSMAWMALAIVAWTRHLTR